MKASLYKHGIDYPKTHDLVLLLTLFPQKMICEEDEIFAHILSRFAVESRYGLYATPPLDDRQMLDKAKMFVELIETTWSH